MSDIKCDGITIKVSSLSEKLNELSTELTELKCDIRSQLESINTHIEQDEKILSKIEPIIPHFESIGEMANDYVYMKTAKLKAAERRKELLEKLKVYLSVTTILSGVGGFFLWIIKTIKF